MIVYYLLQEPVFATSETAEAGLLKKKKPTELNVFFLPVDIIKEVSSPLC